VKANLLAAIKDRTARWSCWAWDTWACRCAEAGFPVVGIRRSQDKVEQINQGICPIKGKEPGLADLLARVVSAGHLRATVDQVCREAQIVLIAVETPVDRTTKKPDYRVLRGALADLGRNLSSGTLVIVESTIAPGTMAQVVKPILEETSGLRANEDF